MSSDTEKEEASPLLSPTPADGGKTNSGTRFPWVCFTIVFLQTFVLNGSDMVALKDNVKYIHVSQAVYKQIGLGYAVLMYIVPITIGIYADTYAGRYRTLIFGVGIKLTGSVCGFIVILVHETSTVNITPILADALLCGFVLCVFLSLVGIGVMIPPALTLGIQHVDQSPNGLASGYRRFILAMAAGIALNDIVQVIIAKEIPDAEDHYQYFMTIYHAIDVAADTLSIALLLVGRSVCRKTSTEAGQQSLKELTHIMRTHVLCFKRRPFDGNIWNAAEMFREEMKKRGLERLKLRKGVLMIAVMSSFSIITSMIYMLNQMFVTHPHGFPGPYYIQELNRASKYYATIIGLLVAEIVAWKTGQHFRLESISNQLKTIGVGSLLAILSLILAGALSTYTRTYGFNAVSAYWIIPQFVVMGFGALFIITGGAAFFYHESPPSLETLVTAVVASFCFFPMAIVAIIGSKVDLLSVVHYDMIFYILAGITIITLLAFAPSAVWYVRADQAIKDFEDEEPPATSTLPKCMHRSTRDGMNQHDSIKLIPYASA